MRNYFSTISRAGKCATIFSIFLAILLFNSHAYSQTQIPLFIDQLNLLSDNAAGYLINADGGTDTTLDVGDRLRGVLRIETIEDLEGGGGTNSLLDPAQPTELTAIYDITVIDKTFVRTTVLGDVYQFSFGPTSVDAAWNVLPGPAPATGTMVRFYEDSAKNFTRLLAEGQTDDDDPLLVGADIGIGGFATEEAIAEYSTDGEPYWDFGFTGPVNAEYNDQSSPAPGQGWVAEAIDDLLTAREIAPPGSGGTVNLALNLKNSAGPPLGLIDTTFGGLANINGSTNILGVREVLTPFDFFNNLDFAIRPVSEQKIGCRVTGGGVDTSGISVDETSWDGTFAEVDPKGKKAGDLNRYQFGGQAGANTALPPQPKGEWTHHQQSGPDGSFIFHAGTASAPEGTEIDKIECSDPDNCDPAREAPAKQIDFEGVGTFKNIKDTSVALEDVMPGETYHWFTVHIEDLGEPGKNKKQVDPDPVKCPPEGSSGFFADCDCPDFYRITIFEGIIPVFDPNTGEILNLNKADVIYEVFGYLDGGNLQIHPPTGFDQ